MSAIDRQPGEEFEYYVDRILSTLYDYISFNSRLIFKELNKINERLTKMATLAEQLGVEETTLAEVVPQLANVITTLESTLSSKETEIKTDLETVDHTELEVAEKNAELAAIQKVQESLAPVVAKAKELVPVAPTTPETPVTPPAEEQPATPPAEETPVAETPPAETPVETPPVETPAEGTPPANPEG